MHVSKADLQPTVIGEYEGRSVDAGEFRIAFESMPAHFPPDESPFKGCPAIAASATTGDTCSKARSGSPTPTAGRRRSCAPARPTTCARSLRPDARARGADRAEPSRRARPDDGRHRAQPGSGDGRMSITMSGYSAKSIDELPTLWDGFARLVRPGLDITAFGANIMDLPPDYSTKSHDEADSGQQELYVALRGSGSVDIDGERLPLDAEHLVKVDAGTDSRAVLRARTACGCCASAASRAACTRRQSGARRRSEPARRARQALLELRERTGADRGPDAVMKRQTRTS